MKRSEDPESNYARVTESRRSNACNYTCALTPWKNACWDTRVITRIRYSDHGERHPASQCNGTDVNMRVITRI